MMCKELKFNEHDHFILFCDGCPTLVSCCREAHEEYENVK